MNEYSHRRVDRIWTFQKITTKIWNIIKHSIFYLLQDDYTHTYINRNQMAVILPILMFKDTHIKAQQMYYIPSFSKSSLIHEQYIHDIHCSSIGLNPLNRVPRVPQKSIGFKIIAIGYGLKSSNKSIGLKSMY